jgi:hypothetical protein
MSLGPLFIIAGLSFGFVCLVVYALVQCKKIVKTESWNNIFIRAEMCLDCSYSRLFLYTFQVCRYNCRFKCCQWQQ